MTSEEHALVHQREQFLAGELQKAEHSRDLWKGGFIFLMILLVLTVWTFRTHPRADRSEALVPDMTMPADSSSTATPAPSFGVYPHR
jgi:hypothetical protein